MPKVKKEEIASNLILLSPPCELAEVVNDVRTLVYDDGTASKYIEDAIMQYSKDQFTQIQLPSSKHTSILCNIAEVDNGVFRCPRSGYLYSYSYANENSKEISKKSPNDSHYGSISLEIWRTTLESEFTNYAMDHFNNVGLSVFAPVINGKHCLIACLESHYCKNTTTGRWRAEWTFPMGEHPEGTLVSASGWVRIQTHLYEEGNIQLIASKEMSFELMANNPQTFAVEAVKQILSFDDVYQTAIAQNFQSMSDTTLKALRRQLPVTKTKIDWNNINSYLIGQEMSKPPLN